MWIQWSCITILFLVRIISRDILGSQQGRIDGVAMEPCCLDAYTARQAEQLGMGRSVGGSGWACHLHLVFANFRQLKAHHLAGQFAAEETFVAATYCRYRCAPSLRGRRQTSSATASAHVPGPFLRHMTADRKPAQIRTSDFGQPAG